MFFHAVIIVFINNRIKKQHQNRKELPDFLITDYYRELFRDNFLRDYNLLIAVFVLNCQLNEK